MKKLLFLFLVISQLFVYCKKEDKEQIKNLDRTEIHLQELLDVYAKCFHIDYGTGVRRICVGKNGINATILYCDEDVKSFCFSCLHNHLYYVFDIFETEVNEIKKISMGFDVKENYLRTQGALYYAILHNRKLINLLRRYYKKNKSNLSFRVKEWEVI